MNVRGCVCNFIGYPSRAQPYEAQLNRYGHRRVIAQLGKEK